MTSASRQAPPLPACQQMLRGLIELSSEVGTPEIILAVAARGWRPAIGRKPSSARPAVTAEISKVGMNGVAGAGMIEREFKQRSGRQARAGAAKPDPRRREIPQMLSERDGGAGVFIGPYSAGTDASRSRIE